MKAAVIIAFAALGTALAKEPKAEKKPKEMKPKLTQAGRVLVEDDFEATNLHDRWKTEGGKAEEIMMLDAGALKVLGTVRSYIEVDFDKPESSVVAQFLFKPHVCRSIAIAFKQEKTSIGHILYASGLFEVLDRGPVKKDAEPGSPPFERLSVKTEQTDPTKWRRIMIETQGDKLLARQDGKVIFDLSDPRVGELKRGFVLAGYGGAFMIDDVKISVAKK
jgi:hypothetical protein